MESVLFLCTSNAVRSPMAAALARRHVPQLRDVRSAGLRTREIDPFAVAVMAEVGLDLAAHRPLALADIDTAAFDAVIALTPEARDHLRDQGVASEFWPLPDPTLALERDLARPQVYAAYAAVRDELKDRIVSRFSGRNP